METYVFMRDFPHSKGQHGRKLGGALLATGTMQADITDMGIHAQ